jgi:hypothetical protein
VTTYEADGFTRLILFNGKISAPSKEAKAAASPVDEMPWANVSDKPKELTFVITGTASTFAFIESFLNANKIKYIKGV